MYKYNKSNCTDFSFASLADYAGADYYAGTGILLEEIARTAPDFALDETEEFAEEVGKNIANRCEDIAIIEDDALDIVLESALEDGNDELCVWLSLWACENETGQNYYLFEASMPWDTDGRRPTDKQISRAGEEAYLFFAEMFNNALPQIYEAWSVE